MKNWWFRKGSGYLSFLLNTTIPLCWFAATFGLVKSVLNNYPLSRFFLLFCVIAYFASTAFLLLKFVFPRLSLEHREVVKLIVKLHRCFCDDSTQYQASADSPRNWNTIRSDALWHKAFVALANKPYETFESRVNCVSLASPYAIGIEEKYLIAALFSFEEDACRADGLPRESSNIYLLRNLPRQIKQLKKLREKAMKEYTKNKNMKYCLQVFHNSSAI